MEKHLDNKGRVGIFVNDSLGCGLFYEVGPDQESSFRKDAVLIRAKLCGAPFQVIKAYARKKYGDILFSFDEFDWRGLSVKWVKEGEPFYIETYDGAETLITNEDLIYIA